MPANRRTYSNQEVAILATIHEDPRDDTSRLVYSDWLEENGQPDLAEFIRLQCKCSLRVFRPGRHRSGSWLVGPDAEQEYPDAWVDKLAELVKIHGDEWYEPLPRQCPSRSQAFNRGLPQVAVRVSDDAFPSSSRAIMRELRPRHEVSVIVDCYEGGTSLGAFRSRLFDRAAAVAVQAFESLDLPGRLVNVPDRLVQRMLKHRKAHRYSRVQFGLVSKEAEAALLAAFPNGSGRSWNHGRF